MPTVPKSYDEFNQRAADFEAKAKSQGMDNTTIANTIKFMYQMTQDAIKQSQMTPAEKAASDLAKQTEQFRETQMTPAEQAAAGTAKIAAQKGTYSGSPLPGQMVNTATGQTNEAAHPTDASIYSDQQPGQQSGAPAADPFAAIAAFDQKRQTKQAQNSSSSSSADMSSSSPNMSTPSGAATAPAPGMTNGQMASYNPNSWQAQVANTNPFARMLPKF